MPTCNLPTIIVYSHSQQHLGNNGVMLAEAHSVLTPSLPVGFATSSLCVGRSALASNLVVGKGTRDFGE
jgi:hypothetical protein